MKYNKLNYKMALPASDILEKIKSLTFLQDKTFSVIKSIKLMKVINDDCEYKFKGCFTGEKFKIQFVPISLTVMQALNPVFYGEVLSEENNNKLQMKIKPNTGGYVFFFGMIIFLILFMLIPILFYNVNSIKATLPISVLLILFTVLSCIITFKHTYSDMQYEIESIFKGYIVK